MEDFKAGPFNENAGKEPDLVVSVVWRIARRRYFARRKKPIGPETGPLQL